MEGYTKTRHSALENAIKSGLIGSDDFPAACFVDEDYLRENVKQILSAYDPNVTILHTIAVKANPLSKVLKICLEEGLGAEVASTTELAQALKVGFTPARIIYDCPAKSSTEIKKALSVGANMNADNLQEVDRIGALINEGQEVKAKIGIRINPQIGAGSIGVTSTATKTSKFGCALEDHREELVERFKKYEWLNMVHVHVGSQGCPVEMSVDAIEKVLSFVQEVNQACGKKQISCLDIGGGMPIDYGSDDLPSENVFAKCARLLKERCPSLFSGEYELITENGRSLVAKAGWVGTKVEYTKVSGGRHIATTHVGADLFLRTCYQPSNWPMRVIACTSSGAAKSGDAVEQDVAGPLCFSGDYIAKDRPLPLLEPGDFVIIPDSGAYTMSMYSRYNSRKAPPTYGYSKKDGSLNWQTIRRGETTEDVLAFWE